MDVWIHYEGHDGPVVNYSYMCACMDTLDDCMDHNGLYAGLGLDLQQMRGYSKVRHREHSYRLSLRVIEKIPCFSSTSPTPAHGLVQAVRTPV